MTWQDPISADLRNGYKVFSSPPPGSGIITEVILKIFDKLKYISGQRLSADVYIKLVEAMKFAFGQRSKLGDPNGNKYEEDIKNVS